MTDFDNIKSALDYTAMSPSLIASLCAELHPEAQNDIEAVDIRINYLNKLIRLKMSANVDSADDIRSYFVLCIVKRQLMEARSIESLQLGFQSGGYINKDFNYDTNRT